MRSGTSDCHSLLVQRLAEALRKLLDFWPTPSYGESGSSPLAPEAAQCTEGELPRNPNLELTHAVGVRCKCYSTFDLLWIEEFVLCILLLVFASPGDMREARQLQLQEQACSEPH